MASKAAPMKPATMKRRLVLAAHYLELEAQQYILDAMDETVAADRKEWGRRASKMSGAAHDLKNMGLIYMTPYRSSAGHVRRFTPSGELATMALRSKCPDRRRHEMETRQRAAKWEGAFTRYIEALKRLDAALETGNGHKVNGARRSCRAARRNMERVEVAVLS